ncbi:MAG TPA: GntR family transcriptional regulator [Candidatus Bathyarchaeia archaeon]|nr:GntR family transcriptional regulator [Candidatus Bathyarchaeia archaeon]
MPRSNGGASAAGTGDLFPALTRHQTLEELAYRDLRRAIVEGRLAPGERIVAATVAAAAGVSRIPVLQALRRLESDGFVRITPHKDVVVLGWARGEIHERFLLMAALEVLCLRQAAGKITPEIRVRLRALQKEMTAARLEQDVSRAAQADGRFHHLLWEIAELPQVLRILENLWDRGEYYRLLMHARRGGFAGESLGEHELILKALEAGDLERAAKAVEFHRLAAMERLERTS